MLKGFYFIFGRDVIAYFKIDCTNVLSLDCKGAAILEIDKLTMKTKNIQKSVRTNLCNNLYKNREWSQNFFFFYVQ